MRYSLSKVYQGSFSLYSEYAGLKLLPLRNLTHLLFLLCHWQIVGNILLQGNINEVNTNHIHVAIYLITCPNHTVRYKHTDTHTHARARAYVCVVLKKVVKTNVVIQAFWSNDSGREKPIRATRLITYGFVIMSNQTCCSTSSSLQMFLQRRYEHSNSGNWCSISE